MIKKDLLILTSVHGDEPDATEIMAKLKLDGELNCGWMIANPKALKAKKRFIDIDLNRIAPGSEKSKFYESRLAVKVLNECKKYKTVIDLHGSKGNQGVFTIVPNPTLENIILAALLPVKNILVWPFNPRRKEGPLMKYIDCGVGIEFGPKETIKTKKLVKEVIDSILKKKIEFDPEVIQQKNFYFVYDKVRKINNLERFKDFTSINIDGEEFCPCFVGAYHGIAFYKTKKMDLKKMILEIN